MSSTDLESEARQFRQADSPSFPQKRRLGHRAQVEVVVRSARPPVARPEDQAELKVLRSDKERLEQACAAAQATIRQLQTKVAHLEMAADEARGQYQRSLDRIQILEAELVEQTALATQARSRLENLATSVKSRKRYTDAPKTVLVSETKREPRKVEVQSKPIPIKFGTPRGRAAVKAKPAYLENQQPVDWWSHHEKKRGRR